MRLASVLSVALVLAGVSPASATNWVHTHDTGSGLPMCIDKDSPKLGADGLTLYAVKMCKDPEPQWYAVDCSKNFKVELVVRIYDAGFTGHFREFSVDNLDSGLALGAMMACKK